MNVKVVKTNKTQKDKTWSASGMSKVQLNRLIHINYKQKDTCMRTGI